MATKTLPPLGTLERFVIDNCTCCKHAAKLVSTSKPYCAYPGGPEIYKQECLSKGGRTL